jgi:hypothetical protein
MEFGFAVSPLGDIYGVFQIDQELLLEPLQRYKKLLLPD